MPTITEVSLFHICWSATLGHSREDFVMKLSCKSFLNVVKG